VEKIRHILKDHKQGAEWLYNQYGHKLAGYAMRVYNVTEDAAWDMVYKTIYKMLEVVVDHEFENEHKLGGFMFRTFVNYLKNYLRDEKTKTGGAVIISIEDSKRDFANRNPQVQSDLKMRLLKAELDKLEDWQRILLLMHSQGCSYADIAKYVNKPEHQLKVYYGRLKNRLAETMQEKLQTVEELKNATNE
jgi:RNA polymerase sigma factor (sigma-70 family)